MIRIASGRPRTRAAFLLALASLLFGGARLDASPDPVFIDWPSAITNVWQSDQITYTNSTYPNGLAVSNIAGAALVTIVSGTNGFSVDSNAGQSTVGGTNFILLYFTPGTNSEITEPYTNTIQVALTNVTGPAPWGGATTNIDIVITPPPPDNPVFTGSFSNQWQTGPSTNPVSYTNLAGCRVSSPPSNSPTQFPVPDITNVTQVFVRFLSNSLGQTGNLTSVALNPSNSYYATSNGFGIQGPYTNVPSGLKPSNPWASAGNLETVASAPGWYDGTNAWVALQIVPGTNALPVTNYVQLLAFNGNNSSTLNWTTNDLAILVEPVLTPPPALEIRFYNTSTNAASNVYIVPSSTDALGVFGNGFWWTNTSGSNNYTNYVNTSGYLSLRLSDLGAPSGTNELGRPYYSVFTTNFPNAAWYISYGGGDVTPAMWATNKPSPKTGALWYGYEWGPFEVTLDGNPSDKSDMTYINQLSIPVAIRALTNDFANSLAAKYPTNSSANLYQVCGFTNWANSNAVATSLSNLAVQLLASFPTAAITNSSGNTVMYAGPSAAPAGTLVAPQIPPYTNGVTPNSFPLFTAYFDAFRTSGAPALIKDYISLAGTNNGGTNTYDFYYELTNTVTVSNKLRLHGKLYVSNAPGSTPFSTTYSNLTMEIGADAGVNDNWASWTVYTAPTPANFVTNGAVVVYSTNAPALQGTPVFTATGNWLAAANATDTGPTNTSPTAEDLFESSFGANVMGRILGDMAAGFALGFINSSTPNPSYGNTNFRASPSGSWWGGDEFPAAGAVNSNAYSDVNTNYSAWGQAIYASATKVTYGHPIYDRMQFYGAANPTSPLQIQPASGTNNVGPTGQLLPVWVVEVEFFNGLSSVGAGPTPPPPPPTFLSYSSWLTNYPNLTGTNTNRSADPDGDGFDNNKEYAFGGNPTVGTPALLVMASSNISFIALSNAASNYTVQNTTNLSTGPWVTSSVPLSNTAPPFPILLPAYYQGMGFTVPLTPGTNNFYRVIFRNQ